MTHQMRMLSRCFLYIYGDHLSFLLTTKDRKEVRLPSSIWSTQCISPRERWKERVRKAKSNKERNRRRKNRRRLKSVKWALRKQLSIFLFSVVDAHFQLPFSIEFTFLNLFATLLFHLCIFFFNFFSCSSFISLDDGAYYASSFRRIHFRFLTHSHVRYIRAQNVIYFSLWLSTECDWKIKFIASECNETCKMFL